MTIENMGKGENIGGQHTNMWSYKDSKTSSAKSKHDLLLAE